MTQMNVTNVFKAAGEDVRLVIAHSTADKLGQETVDALKKKLAPGVVVVAERRIGTLAELLDLVQSAGRFNVLLVVAHGNKGLNAARLFADLDSDGKPVRLKAAELALFEGLLDDKLCLFGVCYYGSEDLASAVVDRAMALACIAPKTTDTITNLDIINGFSSLLNELQARKVNDIGTGELGPLLIPKLDKKFGKSPKTLKEKLKVYFGA
ncbi:MAG: hypothetical protein ABSG31_17125 [Tepidisphaeraceae bacterium]|jgi:hypothetical protein